MRKGKCGEARLSAEEDFRGDCGAHLPVGDFSLVGGCVHFITFGHAQSASRDVSQQSNCMYNKS